jgi:hypothetical protein
MPHFYQTTKKHPMRKYFILFPPPYGIRIPSFLLLFFFHIIGHLTGYIVNGGLGPLL